MTALWLLTLALPSAVALLIVPGARVRQIGLILAPWSALPALALAIWPDPPDADLPWLLLGSSLGLDTTGRVFLFFTALLWMMAGFYGRSYLARDFTRYRFFAFYLLTMTGNFGLIVARDVATFYTLFALMTYSAYGIIVHDRSQRAYRAGRVYIILAVTGELFLVAGFLLAVQVNGGIDLETVPAAVGGSEHRDLIVGLLLAGFGVKAGALPLHVWLPLAHPVAPTPASAVLSGAMIKAGLLGWLRFLPLGEVSLPAWGAICIAAGLGAAFYGVAAGLTQTDPKTNLAYSSISQMGLMTIPVGIGLVESAAWPAAWSACLAYALHHSLTKGALFLGVGVARLDTASALPQRLIAAGLGVAALSLAGAPLTSGWLAKAAMREAERAGSADWVGPLEILLPLAAVGTAVLMGRFLWLAMKQPEYEPAHQPRSDIWIPWVLVLVGSGAAAWLFPSYDDLDRPAAIGPTEIWDGFWPVALGVLAFSGGLALIRRHPSVAKLRIPEGDLLIPIAWLVRRLKRPRPAAPLPKLTDPVGSLASGWYGLFLRSDERDRLAQIELRLTRWSIAGMIFVGLIAALFGVLAISST